MIRKGIVVLSCASLMLAAGCHGKKGTWLSSWKSGSNLPAPPNEGAGADFGAPSGSFELPPLDPSQLPPLETIEKKGIALAEVTEAERKPTTPISQLALVPFGYDSSSLSAEAKTILDGNVQWLKAHANMKVQVEGHCDNKGTTEYNFALGQRRADVVREYLASQGIHPSRLVPISYGEDRPLDPADPGSPKNRRVQFLAFE